MDVINVVRVVLRHPVVVALTMILSAILAVLLITRATPEFEARASVALRPKATIETEKGTTDINPFSNPGSVQVITPALLEAINTPQFVEALHDQGLAGDFSITLNPVGAGSLLALRTINAGPGAALSDLAIVREQMESELNRIQAEAGTKPDQFIVAQTITESKQATRLTGSKARVLLIVLALGAVASYAFARLADVSYGEFHPVRDWFRRRRARRSGSPGVEDEPGDGIELRPTG